ncbi:MAG: hypothetical protein PHE51_04945 [Eubacteriales bacterium]|nr:hypothetical protein [Eubacteriales bacterium]
MEIGQLIYRITGDNSGLKKSLKDSENAAKQSGTSFGNVLKAGLASAAAAVSIGQIINIFKGTVKAASDAAEENQKFGVVFSRSFGAASAAAKELTDSYGLSDVAAKQFLSTNANVFTSLGMTQNEALGLSSQVTKLGVDLASFTNYSGGTEGAVNAISKALIGEREAMKGLGIAILDSDLKDFAVTLGKNYDALTKQEKATLTLQYITKLADNAVGDFARSSDSWANVQRRVESALTDSAVTIGNELLPGLSKLGVAFVESTKQGGTVQQTLKGIASAANWVIEGIAGTLEEQNKWLETQKMANDEGYRTKKQLEEANKEAEEYGKTLARASGKQGTQSEALKAYNKALRDGDIEAARMKNSVDTLKNAMDRIAKEQAATFKGATKNTLDAAYKMTQDYLKLSEEANKKADPAGEAARKQWLDVQKEKYNNAINIAQLTGNKLSEIELTAESKRFDLMQNEKLDSIEKAYAIVAVEKKAADDIFDYKVQKVNEYGTIAANAASGLLSALSSLSQAQTQSEITEIDARQEAALEAAGLAEDTAVEKAQKEYDLALKSADQNKIVETKKALDREKILAKFEKERKKAEYEGALSVWELNVAMASIQVPLAILNTFASMSKFGPIIAGIAAAAAGVTSGIMLASVVEAKPKAPKFESGGIVPGNTFSGDRVSVLANSGEMVLTQDQQAKLFDMANGRATGATGILYKVSPISKDMFLNELFQASQNGELFISQRAVV